MNVVLKTLFLSDNPKFEIIFNDILNLNFKIKNCGF